MKIIIFLKNNMILKTFVTTVLWLLELMPNSQYADPVLIKLCGIDYMANIIH